MLQNNGTAYVRIFDVIFLFIDLLTESRFQSTGHVSVNGAFNHTVTWFASRNGIVSECIFLALATGIFWGSRHMGCTNTIA